MPPKIRGMNANLPLLKRFTLMLSGEDALDTTDDLARLDNPPMGLPHERFLLGKEVPIAPILLLGQTDQAVNPSESIACLQPVHFHATRDHLILMSQNQIDLTPEESSQLLKAVLPYLEEDFENPLLFQGMRDWFIGAGPFTTLDTHSIDQAHGRNIDWWMPRDTHEEGLAKRWRKLQNEIQMLWHIDPINQEREQRGLPSINSIWISGIGKLQAVQTPSLFDQIVTIFGESPLLPGLAKYLNIPYKEKIDPSCLNNGFAWATQPEAVWNLLSQALRDKHLDEVALIDFPKGKTRERVLKAKDLTRGSWAFWKKPEELNWKDITQQ